jgi:PAS domain S-box-containing protein
MNEHLGPTIGLQQEVEELRAKLDVAEKARDTAEKAVHDSEYRFRTFASHTYDWECWHDAEGNLIYSSPSCFRMTGYYAEELYANLLGTMEKMFYPEDRDAIIEHWKHAVSGPAEPLRLCHRIIRRDGEVRWLEHCCQSVYDAEGRYAGRRSSNRDVTDQKRAEDMLQKAHLELERRVEERTSELTRTVERLHNEIRDRIHAEKALQEVHRAMGRLLRSSDHERQLIAYEIHDGLAQCLAGALMQFQSYRFAKDTQPELATEYFDAGLALLQRANDEARLLISGVRPPILDESGVVAAITHLINECRQAEGIEIEFHCDVTFERLDPILENAIYRIVQECLANACKHSGSEKVRIEIMQRDAWLRMEIQDWGKGFAVEATRENCFGLEGVQERARLLGGNVTVKSALHEGARIIAELPLT